VNQLQYLNGFGIASGVASAIVLVAQPAWAQGIAVTNVQLQTTDDGIELILETPTGEQPQSFTSSDGETLVIHFTNSQLKVEEFLEENPIPGIASVEVTQQYANTVRVKLVGTENLPKAQVTTTEQGIALNVTSEMTTAQEPAPAPETQEPITEEPETEEPTPAPEIQEPTTEEPKAEDPEAEEPIELVVTAGEQYRVERATTGTRTDTPIRDIPQSIQVVPKEVIEDQQATDLSEIVRNVSGVVQDTNFGGTIDRFRIRGFRQGTFLRNGFRDGGEVLRVRETANLERVEVLKGPASVLHGRLEPGGVINTVTEKPTEEPFFSFEPRVGSFGLTEPSIDMSGHLNESETLSYRLNALYEEKDGFRDDFDQDFERLFISPVLSWDISDRTNLTIELEYVDDDRPFDRGLSAEALPSEEIPDIPLDRNLQEPGDFQEAEQFIASYELEHQFNENLKLRNRFQYIEGDRFNIRNDPVEGVKEDGTLLRFVASNDAVEKEYAFQTNLVGNFQTGSIEHEVLFGVDLNREEEDSAFRSTGTGPDGFGTTSINAFNPVYDDGTPSRDELNNTSSKDFTRTDSLGIFLQDQIDLSEQFIVVLGGRLDSIDQENVDLQAGTTSDELDESAFTPRIGFVYQPNDSLSFYGSFSQSFVPNTTDGQGDILPPERGNQFELGLRNEFLDGDLALNLAAYNLTKQNIAVGVEGPPPGLKRAIGEQRSRGIELDLAGEITDGWKIIATYALTGTEVTKDNDSDIEGNEFPGIPRHQGSLWTNYEIQEGDLQGLELGAGIFFVGDREGNRDNNIDVPSYARVDARLAYSRNNWEAAVNFKNLFDADIIKSEQAFSRTGLQPGIPFTVIGSFSVEF